MLLECVDCKGPVSSDAKLCPKCGAPVKNSSPGGKSNALGCLIIGALILGAVAVTHNAGAPASGTGPGSDVVRALLLKRDQCRTNVAELENLGVRITDREGGTTAQVDEAVWAGLNYDDKVRQALLIFCAKMPDNGHYYVRMEGQHSGKELGSVVDGNYVD